MTPSLHRFSKHNKTTTTYRRSIRIQIIDHHKFFIEQQPYTATWTTLTNESNSTYRERRIGFFWLTRFSTLDCFGDLLRTSSSCSTEESPHLAATTGRSETDKKGQRRLKGRTSENEETIENDTPQNFRIRKIMIARTFYRS
jgi:hypothetical protein